MGLFVVLRFVCTADLGHFHQNLLIYLLRAQISIFEAHIVQKPHETSNSNYLLKLYLDISLCISAVCTFTHVLQLAKLYNCVPSTQHSWLFLTPRVM